MKALFSFVLIFCLIWESKQDFHMSEPGLYVSGERIPGDEIIYEKLRTFRIYEQDLEVLYPSKTGVVSFYKITRIEFKDYSRDYHVNVGGDINSYRLRLQINKNGPNYDNFKIWIYGIYVGPCKKLPSNYYEYYPVNL